MSFSRDLVTSARRGAIAAALLLASVDAPLAAAAQSVAPARTVEQAALATPAREIPASLARLLGARGGSPEARLGLRLIAKWAALSPGQRAAAAESLDVQLRALDGRSAARLAAMLPLFDGQESLLTQAVQSWAGSDAAACARWVRSRRAGPAREAAIRALASAGDQLSPPDAATWAANELPPGELQDAAVSSALDRWAAVSPSDAAAWAESTLEGPARDRAMSGALESWARRDAGAAAQWADAQVGEGSSRDTARAGLVRAMAGSRPADAVAMAASVESPEERQALLQGTLKHWHAPLKGERGATAQKPKPAR